MKKKISQRKKLKKPNDMVDGYSGYVNSTPTVSLYDKFGTQVIFEDLATIKRIHKWLGRVIKYMDAKQERVQ